jgi:DNA (cytosine-5)-methyltransferase 1
MTFKLISLFSGIGGIDLAFERAGFETVCQVENNMYCQKVLQKHWPNVLRLGDIRDVKGTDLPAADVMAGGFPCQDISIAGKQAGIKEGNRSGLWFEFARLIGEFRPAVVFLENVPAITTNGGTTVLECLAALRYDAEWGIMAAADVGAPHRRERWFCVAYPQSASDTHQPKLIDCETLVSDITQSNDRTFRRDTAARVFVDRRTDAGSQKDLANFDGERQQEQRGDLAARSPFRGVERSGSDMGNAASIRCEEYRPLTGSADTSENEGGVQEPQGRSAIPNPDREPMGRATIAWRERGIGTAEPLLGGMPDGLSAGVDGHRWPARPGEQQYNWEPPRTVNKGEVPHRADRLKALGNAVVPQVVYPFAVFIREVLQTARAARANDGG